MAEGLGTMSEENQDLKRAMTESTLISIPFPRVVTRTTEVAWSTPTVIFPAEERIKQFAWQKPKIERQKLVESVASYHIQHLQKVLGQKNREIKLIANQLMKSNEDNVTLMKELERYGGKKYEDVYQENIILKQRLDRSSRDNAILSGRLQKFVNRRLQTNS